MNTCRNIVRFFRYSSYRACMKKYDEFRDKSNIALSQFLIYFAIDVSAALFYKIRSVWLHDFRINRPFYYALVHSGFSETPNEETRDFVTLFSGVIVKPNQ